MNRIFLRRALKLVIDEAACCDTPLQMDSVIAMLQRNLSSQGYLLSKELAARVQRLPDGAFRLFYEDLIAQLGAITGNEKTMEAMYRDFPEQVKEMPDAQLYLNALYHYLTLEIPSRGKVPRPKLLEHFDPKVIRLGSVEEREALFTNLCAAKTSLSASDKGDLVSFIERCGDAIERLIPAEFPMRETVAVVGAGLLEHTSIGEAFLRRQVKTATDVLRAAAALSGGDVSLSEPCKFRSMKRRQRRLLLSLIERCGEPTQDMLRWKSRWMRLGERLHPGEFREKFPCTQAAFSALRNGGPFVTANSRTERMFEQGDVSGLLRLLADQPGVFARRLDHLLRTAVDSESVLAAFETIADQVATPILLRMVTHFEFRERQHEVEAVPFPPRDPKKVARIQQERKTFLQQLGESWRGMINVVGSDREPRAESPEIEIHNDLLRVFFPKGEVAKVYGRAEPLPLLPVGVAGRAAAICRRALVVVFSAKPKLGKCWIDPALRNFRVPIAQRSAAKSLRTLSRGSRMALPDAGTLRFFIWWKNGDYRTDLDLSAAFYDADFDYVDVVSYYNLKNFGGHHSGDIVDAPDGAAEFIDIDIEKAREKGVRYVVMSVNSYTQQPYCDLPECFAGWMARKHPNSGEIFEGRTVQDKIDLAANTRIALPLVFDLDERSAVWCDLGLKKSASYNNVANNLSGVSLMLRSMLALKTPDLHTLFLLHAEARGELVERREEADLVFAVEGGDVTPFDSEKIGGDYL